MKRKSFHLLLLLFVLITVTSPVNGQNFRFVSFADYYGGIEPSDGYQNLRSRIFMRPTFSGVDDNSGFEWQISANLWMQPFGDSMYINPWDVLHESYLFLPFNYLDITLGQKIITYGFSDIRSPLNPLHSTNSNTLSLDEYFDSRRPDPLLQLKIYPTFEDTIELTYIPITRPDKERQGPVMLTGSNDTLEWGPDSFLTTSESLHSIFVNYNHYGEKMDFQIFYGWYTEHTPDFVVQETSTTHSSVIEPIYRKKHTFGFAYSLKLWVFTLSQDFAFNLTSDFNGTDIGAQNSDISINTQVLVQLPWGILSQFNLNYAFFPNHNNHSEEGEGADYLSREIQSFHTQPQQHIAYIIAHFEKTFLRERMKTTLNLGYFFSPAIYLGPRVSYNISDHWQFEVGADIHLLDPSTSDLRRNATNDNYYARLLFRY